MLFNETMSARCNWAINPQQNIPPHNYLLCTNISLTVSCYHSIHIIMVTIQGLFVTTGLRIDSLSKKGIIMLTNQVYGPTGFMMSNSSLGFMLPNNLCQKEEDYFSHRTGCTENKCSGTVFFSNNEK